MYLIPIPALADNYLCWLHDGKRALAHYALQLESILVTPHHADHTGGVDALRKAPGCAGKASRPCPVSSISKC